MPSLHLATDPLWMCLCPAWSRPVVNAATPHLRARRAFTSSSKHHIFGRYHEKTIAFKKPVNVQIQDHDATDLPTLHTRLRESAERGHTFECQRIIQHLVQVRGEKPSVQLYNELILTNINASCGSAWRLYELLAEMHAQKLRPDTITCHNILRVLAVHPDHLLQHDILRYMQENWISLSDAGHCDVIVGHLRDGCFEMALDALERMQQKGTTVPSWLLDMTAYMLSEAGELDAAYHLMRRRWNANEHDISPALWFWLLDRACRALHVPMTEFIWRTRVNLGKTDVSIGMCNNALSTAARGGQPALATQVFGYLTKRGEKLTSLQFQLLIDSYTNQEIPDIEKAFSVLSLMSLERLSATKYHTRSIYTALKESFETLEGALETLRKLHNDGKIVPVAALNVLIECHAAHEDFEGALSVYKQIHSFSTRARQMADIETFHHLLKACRFADISQADFLWSELNASDLQPDLLVHDRFILLYCRAADEARNNSDVETSRRHAQQALSAFSRCQDDGFAPRFGTVESLASCLAALHDNRCWDVVQFAHDQGRRDWKSRLIIVKDKLEALWQQASAGNVIDGARTAAASP